MRRALAMDTIDRLIQAFGAQARSAVVARLDILMDLERLEDPRVAPFLVQVLGDQHESTDVRVHVLKQLRTAGVATATRELVTEAMLRILSDSACSGLRLEAAVALGEFVDVPGVPAALGRLARDVALPIDLRYSAFISLERAGPTAESVALLRQLETDELLGRSAQSTLAAWHLA